MANTEIMAVKFTPQAKLRYLEELALSGRKLHSATVAGISRQCVNEHIQDDPEFAEAVLQALDAYAEFIRSEVRRRATGWLEPVFHQGSQGFTTAVDERGEPIMETVEVDEYVVDAEKISRKTGRKVTVTRHKMIPTYVRKFSERMLELEVKRVDPAYREKGTIDMNVTGGILVVPGMSTPEAFEKEYSEQNQLNPKGRTLEHQK